MNREQFISELKSKLTGIPFDEATSAVAFYEEYFDEAGEQNEQTAIEELGSPGDVAAKIIGEFAFKGIEESPKSAKKSLSIIWLVILGIFASPIALPLAMVAVIVVFVIIIVIFSVAFAFGAAGFAVAIAGIVTVIASGFFVFASTSSTIFYLGAGLFTLALGGYILMLTAFVYKKSVTAIAKLMSKSLLRRGTK